MCTYNSSSYPLGPVELELEQPECVCIFYIIIDDIPYIKYSRSTVYFMYEYDTS